MTTQPPDPRFLPLDAAAFPAGDYVSPGLRLIRPDECFPFMAIVPDRTQITWPYFRGWIPHTYRCDRRLPTIGFVSRDEAHLLYNTALLCRGQPALEIGCWMGWSSCHIALAGVDLDVVDPLLGRPDVQQSVAASLQAARLSGRVRLLADRSPEAVLRLHQTEQLRWGFIFVDGNHDRPGPLQDAQAAHVVAAPNAMVLFHDLVSPEVAEGLNYLRDQGWHTLIYQTVQIMGVAWRGAAKPLTHVPDPQVAWSLPSHLASYRVANGDPI
jgi:predicted O-methyltransferase YrrM